MEYFIIITLQLLGIGFHVVQKVNALDKEHPELKAKQIYALFFENEWSSLSISALVLIADILRHAIVDLYFPEVRNISFNVPLINVELPYLAICFIGALIAGYAGQRLAYKYLGKAEQYLSKNAD